LTSFAQRRLGPHASWAEAEDLAQDAIRRAFDPAHVAWDPRRQPDLFRYLGSIVNGLVQNRRRHAQCVAASAQDLVRQEEARADGLLPDTRVERRELAQRALDWLSGAVEGDALAAGVLRLQVEQTDDVGTQAASLRAPRAEVYAARRRLRGHFARLARQLV
jgi:hypothetical protein